MNIVDLLDDARARLRGAHEEALGELVLPRRVLGVGRAPRILARGTAWHLGALLLTDEQVLATGEIIRARAEAVRGFTAQSQRERAALAAAASRGGFAEGAVVHIGWQVLDVDAVSAGETSGPLAVRDGVPSIRWSASAGYAPLAGYLRERIDLLLSPPAGA